MHGAYFQVVNQILKKEIILNAILIFLSNNEIQIKTNHDRS